jgi:hypothetical protein
MASSAAPELDKTFQSDTGESYGEMKVRVVVLKKRSDPDGDESAAPEEDDFSGLGKKTKKPTDPFLESPKQGKECCVFLINGQRQDAWDDTFIVRDLGLKYLRQRMLTVVDLDGLNLEAINKLMQGTRQAFYRGEVYHAVSKRLIATLKGDPDLDQLEKEAEQNLLEMKGADEAVKSKLDQLIEGHHIAAENNGPGNGDSASANSADGSQFAGTLDQRSVVTKAGAHVGQDATLPVLMTEPNMVAVRMYPDETARFIVLSEPTADWADLQDFSIRLQHEEAGLSLSYERGPDSAQVTLRFTEPDDMEADEYPVTTELLVFATFKGKADTRMLSLPVVIVKPRGKKPKKERVLRADPTYLRVVSRQPVKLVPNSPSLHVKLAWDGEDCLLAGTPPPWRFRGRCSSLATFPQIGFAFGRGGRLAALIDTPNGLIPGGELDFEIEALGPNGKSLTARFKGRVDDPQQPAAEKGPRLITAQTPDTAGQRRPPYKLVYVDEDHWNEVGCWVDSAWTADDVGCFHEPTAAAPLVLVLNEDFALSKQYFARLVGRLEEETISERKNKFYSHVAFHLYQMYLSYRRQMDASSINESAKIPEFSDLRSEINRVGTTLMKLMEVSR